MCKSYVKRNSEALIDELRPLAAKDSDGSLKAIGVEPVQAVADLVVLAGVRRRDSPLSCVHIASGY